MLLILLNIYHKMIEKTLIKLNNFKIDPSIFIELNEAIQTEITKYLSNESIVYILKNSRFR